MTLSNVGNALSKIYLFMTQILIKLGMEENFLNSAVSTPKIHSRYSI